MTDRKCNFGPCTYPFKSLVEENFLSGVFSSRKHICVADRHDMSLAVKAALTHSHSMTPFDAPGKQAF